MTQVVFRMRSFKGKFRRCKPAYLGSKYLVGWWHHPWRISVTNRRF